MKELISQKIAASPKKMISYADFIELVLYHPDMGYYMKNMQKIGTRGDFYTTSNVSDVFGKLVGKWFANNAGKLDLPASVCEIGGGNGRFARAFIEGWKENSDEKLNYFLVEKSPYHRMLQKEEIGEVEGVQITYIDHFVGTAMTEGLVFSNELFDAFPVHVIEKRGNVLQEVFIGYEEGRFVEKLLPLANEKILYFLEEEGIVLAEGQRMEIPLSMEPFIRSIAEGLQRGLVITVDYGYTKEEWMHPARQNGSLRGYFQHQMVHDVLKHPGEMDITSHIHVDALISQGEKYALEFLEKKRQDEFLLSIGILDELADHQDTNPFSEASKRNRSIRSLIMPGSISESFTVVIQGKGIKQWVR